MIIIVRGVMVFTIRVMLRALLIIMMVVIGIIVLFFTVRIMWRALPSIVTIFLKFTVLIAFMIFMAYLV